jgi:hypothetical protein
MENLVLTFDFVKTPSPQLTGRLGSGSHEALPHRFASKPLKKAITLNG